ncbi:MAG TPA: damage-inducible protein D [Verrucomicrobiota bacterium]|jgi:DNA-damage-inducible protein D|nr:damage-inducible protein D [Verrucomicrobiota bacterium]HOH39753.1 damage-inducible protein D [Verrucomicrobiota bacterium]
MNDTPETSAASPFHMEPQKAGFESMGHDNGFRFWWGSDLAALLGYDGLSSFRKAIERAMVTLTSLNVPIFDNIIQEQRDLDGKMVVDYKLSRFACYLAAMNGDPKKPQVAKAQAYFVMWAEACRLSLEQAEGVERVGIRAEISEHERTLSGTAHQAGVANYAFFQNAGYRGLYNMDLWQIRRKKGVPERRSPLDFMGKTELAANLFRVTQTEEKIRASRIRGQDALERTAHEVGHKVRKTMIEISGRRPEDLPPSEDIKEVHKKLKSSHREIRKLDKPAAPPRQLPPPSDQASAAPQ